MSLILTLCAIAALCGGTWVIYETVTEATRAVEAPARPFAETVKWGASAVAVIALGVAIIVSAIHSTISVWL